MVAIHLTYKSYLSLAYTDTSSKAWFYGIIKWVEYTYKFL